MSQPFDPSDADAVAERDARIVREREEEYLALKEFIGHKAGRRYLWRFLSHCGIYQTSMRDGRERVEFNEGQRNVGLMILTDLMRIDPDAFVAMARENANG